MIEKFKKICPKFKTFLESSIIFNEKIVGWNCVSIDDNGTPIGGGTSSTREMAKRIAIAETLERNIVKSIDDSVVNRSRFLMNDYPTTCGFAVGFEYKKTLLRAICESLEQWVWSKWIDENFKLERDYPEFKKLSDLGKYFYQHFDEIYFYSKKIDISHSVFGELNLVIGIALSFKGNGIFPGSRVDLVKDSFLWEHTLLESWRHLGIFTNFEEHNLPINIFNDRIIYFGNQKDCALKQVLNAYREEWTNPTIKILENYSDYEDDSIFVWRAILDDHLGWHHKDKTRFVY